MVCRSPLRLEKQRFPLIEFLADEPCWAYSPHLKKLIFCNPNRVFKPGGAVPIEGDPLKDTFYIGDIPHWDIAVFQDEDGGLLTTDGRTSRRITSDVAGGFHPWLYVLPKARRAFLFSVQGLIEFVMTEGTVEARRIELGDSAWIVGVADWAGEAFLFHDNNISRVVGGELELVWRGPDLLHPISETPSGGILFSSDADGFLGLLQKCSDN